MNTQKVTLPQAQAFRRQVEARGVPPQDRARWAQWCRMVDDAQRMVDRSAPELGLAWFFLIPLITLSVGGSAAAGYLLYKGAEQGGEVIEQAREEVQKVAQFFGGILPLAGMVFLLAYTLRSRK